ncbi:signal peptidase I [Nitrosarchaeum sp. AC2]|uniref:signal peptidase I n=1 Tax=Nitrosarchaeum sp. AC2 TaxID=2259673 RepID=UPI0015DC1432|nr:signal peptidase I [Nitrosarchaeum sp. AC2]QLH11247.1 signal peptidase I [Nitrosarchaeum sp. AC2]
MHKTKIHFLSRYKIIIFSFIVVFCILLLFVNFHNPFYVITSGSMLPTLKQGDVVFVVPVSYNSLKIGDVIAFKKFFVDSDHIFIHRIIEIDDAKLIKTKGDYGISSIPDIDYPITKSDYVGKVLFVFYSLGSWPKLLDPPVNYIIIFMVIISSVVFLKQRQFL